MDNRTPREIETRERTERPKQWQPPQTLPTPKDSPGWVYRWIRTSIVGQGDPTNVSQKFREGWEPVKLADHPELMLMASAKPEHKDLVEVGGLILCKCPRETMEQRDEYYRRQSQSQIEAVDNNFMRENDPRMPMDALGKAIERKSQTSFGRGK